MAGTFDTSVQEKEIGTRATNLLRTAFKSALAQTVNVQGASKKATVRSRYRYGRLDRLSFVAPYYVFMQHNGFEGPKKNGVTMRLTATDVLNKALDSSGVLNSLADDLADLRAEEVVTAINFTTRGQQ